MLSNIVDEPNIASLPAFILDSGVLSDCSEVSNVESSTLHSDILSQLFTFSNSSVGDVDLVIILAPLLDMLTSLGDRLLLLYEDGSFLRRGVKNY